MLYLIYLMYKYIPYNIHQQQPVYILYTVVVPYSIHNAGILKLAVSKSGNVLLQSVAHSIKITMLCSQEQDTDGLLTWTCQPLGINVVRAHNALIVIVLWD